MLRKVIGILLMLLTLPTLPALMAAGPQNKGRLISPKIVYNPIVGSQWWSMNYVYRWSPLNNYLVMGDIPQKFRTGDMMIFAPSFNGWDENQNPNSQLEESWELFVEQQNPVTNEWETGNMCLGTTNDHFGFLYKSETTYIFSDSPIFIPGNGIWVKNPENPGYVFQIGQLKFAPVPTVNEGRIACRVVMANWKWKQDAAGNWLYQKDHSDYSFPFFVKP